MTGYYEEEPVAVVDPRVDIDIPDEFEDDPHLTNVTVRKSVDVVIPGYKCEGCGARWYPDRDDSLADSRRHYENHKRRWCTELDTEGDTEQ